MQLGAPIRGIIYVNDIKLIMIVSYHIQCAVVNVNVVANFFDYKINFLDIGPDPR